MDGGSAILMVQTIFDMLYKKTTLYTIKRYLEVIDVNDLTYS